jgi:phosphatidylserine/phosphatidylglycerophosphate/cardiolipin synthase-like enzyme
MPRGERTILGALTKAIGKAECYIYIEEQYLWDGELADAIGQAMVREPRLRLIVVLAATTQFLPPTWEESQYHARSLFFKTVMDVSAKKDIAFGPKTRVYPYGLYQTPNDGGHPIYVHSKLVIIDDRYVAVGSANVNGRSMHIDTELALGIVDRTTELNKLDGLDARVCVFARNLRETLWKEHLGLTSLPADPIRALGEFPQGFVTPWSPRSVYTWPTNEAEAKIWTRHHARCYVNKPGTFHASTAEERMFDRTERRWRTGNLGE